MSSYVGEIAVFPYNFAPIGWAMCEGQLLAIAENDTLFNLLGTRFGGDGQETFALPDMRSANGSPDVGGTGEFQGYHKGLEFTSLRYYISLYGIYPTSS